MSTFDHEEWRELYKRALLEVEHTRIIGRIETARKSIMTRIEKLSLTPGPHEDERAAMEDALYSLRVLAHEEERLAG